MVKRTLHYLFGEPHPHSMTTFLVLLCLELFVFGPLSRELGPTAGLINGVVFSASLLLGTIALSPQSHWQAATILVALAAIGLRWSSALNASLSLQVADRVATIAVAIVLVRLVWLQITHRDWATMHKIRGAVSAYLLLAVTFGALHNLVEIAFPGAYHPAQAESLVSPHARHTFLYFSMTTLTTLGFGDIAPMQPLARSMVMLEAIMGMLYPPTIIGLLVNLHTEQVKGRQDTSRVRTNLAP
jgi:hypothetical protein